MELDDHVCLCFHVTRRKVVNFVRIEKPRRASQMADCFGAGTGCGWCRPFLQRIYEQVNSELGQPQDPDQPPSTTSLDQELPDRSEYAQLRAQYVREGKGTPPTPLD